MQKTKIDWTDESWNPVSGCIHNCPYCYARGIAKRFGGQHVQGIKPIDSFGGNNVHDFDWIFDIAEPLKIKRKRSANNPYTGLVNAPFPYGFCPTFHRYRLDQPQHKKKPQNIFVGSMADLFGEWVPDEWIETVFKACEKAPQHRYLFLTKNGKRYEKYIQREMPSNFWFGQTITEHNPEASQVYVGKDWNTFTSLEPLLGDFPYFNASYTQWVIIGAETGDRKGKVIPKREWIENIVNRCRLHKVPVFMKDSLADIWREPLIQEYPWKEGERE